MRSLLIPREVKITVFRVRLEYFDQILNGTKNVELRKDSEFWRRRLLGPRPPSIALFLCGPRKLYRRIVEIRADQDPEAILGRPLSAQGKKDIPTPKCFTIFLGDSMQPPRHTNYSDIDEKTLQSLALHGEPFVLNVKYSTSRIKPWQEKCRNRFSLAVRMLQLSLKAWDFSQRFKKITFVYQNPGKCPVKYTLTPQPPSKTLSSVALCGLAEEIFENEDILPGVVADLTLDYPEDPESHESHESRAPRPRSRWASRDRARYALRRSAPHAPKCSSLHRRPGPAIPSPTAIPLGSQGTRAPYCGAPRTPRSALRRFAHPRLHVRHTATRKLIVFVERKARRRLTCDFCLKIIWPGDYYYHHRDPHRRRVLHGRGLCTDCGQKWNVSHQE